MEEVEPGEESNKKFSLLRERVADLETWLVRERTRCRNQFEQIKEEEMESTLRWISELETAGINTIP